MRSASRRAGVVVAGAAAVAGIAAGVSARSGPDTGVRAVCGAAQAMVDRQNADDYPGQLEQLQRLEATLGQTDNRSLRSAGTQLFAALTGPAPDPSGQTVRATVELGQRYARSGAVAFDKIRSTCKRVGLELHNLPSGDKPAFRSDATTTTTQLGSTSP